VAGEDDTLAHTRTEELLQQLRFQAEVSKEERRVVSESMATHSAEAKIESAGARIRATKRLTDTRSRVGRKKR
jgi:hypothetical protein